MVLPRKPILWRWLAISVNQLNWKTKILDYALIYGIAGVMMLIFAPESALSPSHAWQRVDLPKQPIHCLKLQVFDGDTLGARCGVHLLRIRLHGIDAPEMAQKPYGTQAQSALQTLLPKSFTLEPHGQDIYGRTLGTLHDKTRNINHLLVQLGYAVAYEDKNTPDLYRQAETAARKAQRGVWQETGLQQRPKIWRRYY